MTEVLIATALERGECGIAHAGARTGPTLTWNLADLLSCWLFASYGGGCRGHEVLVLEPCSGYPLSVHEGVAAGTQPGPPGRSGQGMVADGDRRRGAP